MIEFTIDQIKEEPQDFMMSASWCTPCKHIKIMNKYTDVAYINLDEDESAVESWCRDNNIIVRAFPTLIEYRNGKFFVSNMDIHRYLDNKRKEQRNKDYIEFKEV